MARRLRLDEGVALVVGGLRIASGRDRRVCVGERSPERVISVRTAVKVTYR
jgi:hypothetical protein